MTTTTGAVPHCPECAGDAPFRLPAPSSERAGLLRDGLVGPVVADVVAPAGATGPAVRARSAAVLLAARESGASWVVGLGSAAWLLTGGVLRDDETPAVLEVIVPPGARRPSGRGGVLGRQVALGRGDVTHVHGVAVTAPLRTAADLARSLPPDDAVQALRRLGRLCGVRPPQVLRQLSRMRYARNSAAARPVVRRWADEPEPW